MDSLDMCPPLAPEHLASFLGPDTLFVDVREETTFHRAHLRGALPLALPSVLWRRFFRNRETPGSLTRHLLSDALAPLKKLKPDTMLVLYDEDTTNLAALAEEAPLRVFAEYFAREKVNVVFIEGGFRAAKALLASQVVASDFGGLPVMVAPDYDFAGGHASARKKRCEPSTELNWIHGFLAIGSEKHAHDVSLLKSEGVTHILNLTDNPSLPDAQRAFTTLQVQMRDTLSENLLAHLYKALDFVDQARRQGGRILVHCFAGISRSVSVSIAYLMWAFELSLDTAMQLVKTHRDCASPNLNFVGQLMMFERTLARGSTPASSAASSPEIAADAAQPVVAAPPPLRVACDTALEYLQAAIAIQG